MHADLHTGHRDRGGADGQQAARRWCLHQGDPVGGDHHGNHDHRVIIREIMIIVIIFRKTKMLSALLLSTVVSHFTTPNSMTRSEGVNRNTRYQYDGDGDGDDRSEMIATNNDPHIRWH